MSYIPDPTTNKKGGEKMYIGIDCEAFWSNFPKVWRKFYLRLKILKLLSPELYLPFTCLSYASDLIFSDRRIINNPSTSLSPQLVRRFLHYLIQLHTWRALPNKLFENAQDKAYPIFASISSRFLLLNTFCKAVLCIFPRFFFEGRKEKNRKA